MKMFKKSEVGLILQIRSKSAILTDLLLLLRMTFCTASASVSSTTSEQACHFIGCSLESSAKWLQMKTSRSRDQGDAFKTNIDLAGQTLTSGDHISLLSASDRTIPNAILSQQMYPMAYIDVEGNTTNDNFIIAFTKTKPDSRWSALSTENFLKLHNDRLQLNSNETTAKSNLISEASNLKYNADDTTFSAEKTPVTQREQPLVSSDVRISISRYYALVVNPTIGIIGLVTNVISGIVIIRSGLRKPSNIFLLALAVSDWVCMLRNVNVAWLLTYQRQKFPQRLIGWEMPLWSSYLCYVVDKTIVRASNFAAGMSTAVTVLITLERLLATFLPLQFSSIVTSFRAWVVLGSTVACLLPPYMLKIFLNEFRYAYYPNFNASMGTFRNSAFYNSSLTAMKIFNSYFTVHFEFTLPLAIVLLGSVLISVKIVVVRKKRQAMVQGVSASTRATTRTTSTLLMVCLLFSFTRISYLFVYLPIFDDTKIRTMNVSFIFVDVRWSLVQVNSACNIVVYVLFNPKFKRILKSSFLGTNNRCTSF